MTPPRRGSHRPIIVVGCPRSGTTLLTVMLHAHSRLAMPPETRFVVPLYRRRARFGDLTDPDRRRAVARWVVNRRQFADLGLPPRTVRRQIVAGEPTIGAAAAAVFQAYADRHGKARWGDKRPAYWADMDVILRLFPDAQIVHVIRDPRACVSSLKQMPWWKRGSDGALTTWLLAEQRIRRDTRRLGADSYLEVYYEQLVADPEGELRTVCRFLGERFEPAMLRHQDTAGQIVPGYKTWHDRIAAPVDTTRTDAWRTGLTPAEIGLIESVAGRAMTRRGYRLSGSGVHPSAKRLAGFTRTYLRRRAKIRRTRAQDALLRMRLRQPVGFVTDKQWAGRTR